MLLMATNLDSKEISWLSLTSQGTPNLEVAVGTCNVDTGFLLEERGAGTLGQSWKTCF